MQQGISLPLQKRNQRMVLFKKLLLIFTLFFGTSHLSAKEELSRLDGQLVKVGDKNSYEYAYKKFNVGINPFSPIHDELSISGSVALNPNIAARVSAAVNFGDKARSTLSSLGRRDATGAIGVPVYFSKVYSGFFFEPGYDTSAQVYSTLGYHWMWDSGFNIASSIGVSRGRWLRYASSWLRI
jgi:hypothetical protein